MHHDAGADAGPDVGQAGRQVTEPGRKRRSRSARSPCPARRPSATPSRSRPGASPDPQVVLLVDHDADRLVRRNTTPLPAFFRGSRLMMAPREPAVHARQQHLGNAVRVQRGKTGQGRHLVPDPGLSSSPAQPGEGRQSMLRASRTRLLTTAPGAAETSSHAPGCLTNHRSLSCLQPGRLRRPARQPDQVADPCRLLVVFSGNGRRQGLAQPGLLGLLPAGAIRARNLPTC